MNNSLVINGRFVTRGVTGVERFASEVLCCIDDLIAAGEFSGDVKLVIPPNAHCSIGLRRIEVVNYGTRQGHFWEQFDLPRFANGIDADILNLCNTGPVFTRRNSYVVLHDAAIFAVPHAYGLKFRIVYYAMHKLFALRKKIKILTVSNFSRSELSRFLGVNENEIAVIGESGEHILKYACDESLLSKFNLTPKGYALIVSSRQPAKNTDFVIRAFSNALDHTIPLVIAGGSNKNIFTKNNKLECEAESHGFIYVGYVSNEQLRSLYENASCFIFPSLYEGYGLPPQEAMCLGCPVLASNAASLPEVCGDAALFFDPKDEISFRSAFQTFVHSSELRDDLGKRGLQHSSKYKWHTSARSILQMICDDQKN